MNKYSISNRLDDIKLFNKLFTLKNTIDSDLSVVNKEFFPELFKNSQWKYIKSGSTGHTLRGKVKLNNKDFYFGMKIVAYPIKKYYGKPTDENRPENAELRMLQRLSKLAIDNNLLHVVFPISNFTMSLKPFIYLKDYNVIKHDRFDEFVKKYREKSFYEEASILISEWANMGDFLDYLRDNYKKISVLEWKVFLFQIIATLAIIQEEFPHFRHNDLKANNILIHKISKDTKFFRYKIRDKFYKVPNIGFILKIWDFDFSCIKDDIKNHKVNMNWTKKINVIYEQNRYYDIHYFFSTLTMKGFIPNLFKHVDEEIKSFMLRIVPNNVRTPSRHCTDRGRILVRKELTTPRKILKYDSLFESFVVNE